MYGHFHIRYLEGKILLLQLETQGTASPSSPTSTITPPCGGALGQADAGPGSKGRLLPLGWGAVAVVIGVVTLFIICSTVPIIIVLKHTIRRDIEKTLWQERALCFQTLHDTS